MTDMSERNELYSNLVYDESPPVWTRPTLKYDPLPEKEAPMPDQYADLRRILDTAFIFASEEKGHERHGGNGLDWGDQRHAAIASEVGTGFAIGQAVKKSFESERLEPDAAKRELLGAITYLASAIYAIEKGWR